MYETAKEFVSGWNNHHKHEKIIFYVDGSERHQITDLKVRFAATKYRRHYEDGFWDRLTAMVEQCSHGTIFVASNKTLFNNGILEMKVASANNNYKEEYFQATLCWLGEELFPSIRS